MAVFTGAHSVRAHEAEHTAVAFRFARDGSFVLDVTNDANWLLMRLESFVAMEGGSAGQVSPGRPSDQERDDRLRALTSIFADRIVIWLDGREVRAESVEYVPPRAETPQDRLQPLAAYRFRGHVPAGARSLRWYYGMVADAYPVSVARADGRTETDMIVTGDAWSRTLDLSGQFGVASTGELAREYFDRGFASVLPGIEGFVLFILGLVGFVPAPAAIVRRVAVFALAQSAVLWLIASTGLAIPARLTSGLIAVSIVYVLLDSGRKTRELTPLRTVLIVICGVVYAAALADRFKAIPAPAGKSTSALLAFNAGVEVAVMLVLAFAWLAFTVYRWYKEAG